ncbi:serine/threonine-protein kinase [Streptomyces sp. WMMC940]|uniref:serine/threonine-protein kinase n=1 Tax=Streptomyces sp. WMMC940 TaxID=3015153 RepID=UPI0022B7506C|nr:serine/threonine-protein kinase [Streptomyces sp. WMMC940]MCZ7459710.1 serine/threonine-protein kinase [Streptomyces sp. WMMC940]
MRDQLLGGRYRLVRQLGEGGMGQVWEAQDKTLGRPVAVKVISLLAGGGSRGGEARTRFLREARITARLQHPHIVTIHDLGETDTGDNRAPFLVMELIRGEGLDTMLRRGAVTLPDAARWGAQICDALADAHEAGIMHRDIKPSNILITPSGNVKVLDFGVARAADPYATADRLTQTGLIVGTPPYMAPEQARGFPEPSSDLYALGCLLFELITGQLPFQAPDTVGYLSAHLTQEPPTPSSVSTDIPSAWDDLVLTLLHKDPTQRYPNAANLSQALQQLDRTHILTTAGPIRVPSHRESRAALLARLATAMRAAHDVAASRIPDAQHREASDQQTTAMQPPPPRTLPLDGTPSRANGPVTISWTGKEPLSAYMTGQGRGVVVGFTITSAVALAGFLISLALAPDEPFEFEPGHPPAWTVTAIVFSCIGVFCLSMLLLAAIVKSLEPNRRSAWSLEIGPRGIRTTTQLDRHQYRWSQVRTFAVEEVFGYHEELPDRVLHGARAGLHVKFAQGEKPSTPHRPPGWPYGTKTRGRNGMVPICVLGPMTDQQRAAVTEALTRYGQGKSDAEAWGE